MLNFTKSLFSQKDIIRYGFQTDFHSHLLPNLDDGSKSFEQSLELIQHLQSFGVEKIITTPHIYSTKYKNSPTTILPRLEELKKYLLENNCNIEIQAAAEYYLDEILLEKLRINEPLLTFGNKNLLFELSFINESRLITEAVFLMLSQGYKPILAHPERYMYYHFECDKLEEIRNSGIGLQLNINSLSGYYGENERKMAQKLIDANLIDYVGSDTHHLKHIESLKLSLNTLHYKKLLKNNIKNNEL